VERIKARRAGEICGKPVEVDSAQRGGQGKELVAIVQRAYFDEPVEPQPPQQGGAGGGALHLRRLDHPSGGPAAVQPWAIGRAEGMPKRRRKSRYASSSPSVVKPREAIEAPDSCSPTCTGRQRSWAP
jgi:hypothetical protein